MNTVTAKSRLTTGPIIMVDDSHDDFYLAQRMYKRSNLANPLVHFESGRHLLDYLDAYEDQVSAPIRFILMDVNMPGMDGIETVAAVRKRTSYAETPVLVMLTSSSDPRDRERASDAGADEYFVKPMGITEYVELFNRLGAATA